LYEVPEDYDHVIFDLFWGYPQSGKDYLDASVLLYSDSDCVEVVDFHHESSQSCTAVKHSGDLMDDKNRLGHQTINVSIKSIPAHINNLVFTLSAWRSPNISKYPNPSVKFFDARCPRKQLCDDKMDHAAYSQAIIMCFLTNRGGTWRVVSVKRPSDGNAMSYGPLKNSIVSLILLEKSLK
jgi:stress response protein SCP2